MFQKLNDAILNKKTITPICLPADTLPEKVASETKLYDTSD